jgi:hypothetical protein
MQPGGRWWPEPRAGAVQRAGEASGRSRPEVGGRGRPARRPREKGDAAGHEARAGRAAVRAMHGDDREQEGASGVTGRQGGREQGETGGEQTRRRGAAHRGLGGGPAEKAGEARQWRRAEQVRRPTGRAGVRRWRGVRQATGDGGARGGRVRGEARTTRRGGGGRRAAWHGGGVASSGAPGHGRPGDDGGGAVGLPIWSRGRKGIRGGSGGCGGD